jgi:protein TonB
MRCDVPLSVVENYLNVPTAEEARAADAVALMARHTAFTAQEPEAEADHGARLRPPRLRLLIAAALLLAAASLAIGLWKGRQWQRGSNDALSLAPPPALALPPPPMVLAVKPTATAPEIRRAAKPQEPALTARPAVLKERDEAESVQWVAKAAMKPVPTVQPVEPASLPVTTTDLPRLPQTIVIPEGPTAKRDAVEVSRVSGGKLVHKVSPVYPSMAKVTGRTGTVKLTALITRNGKLANLRVQAGDALLANAAIQAVMHWRYEPYRLNGKPIEVETTITVNFGRE